MKKRIQQFISTFFALFTAALCCLGQQEIQSSQFMINPFLQNPAYSSMDDNLDAKLSNRSQWLGVEGAPRTSYFSIHAPVGKPRWAQTHPGDFHDWHGVGMQIINDRLGPYNNYRFNANYSYNIGFTQGDGFGYEHTDGLRVALGTFFGWNSFSIDTDLLAKSKTNTGSRIDNDVVYDDATYQGLTGINSSLAFDMTFGALFYYGNKYYLGVSTTQIFENDIQLTSESSLNRHYFVSAKVKHQISEPFYIIPSVIVKYVKNAPVSYNINARLDWQDKLFGGIGYRSGDAVILMVGAEVKWGEKIKNFRRDKHRYRMHFYYTYDYTTSKLGEKNLLGQSKGSHEITIAFLLPPFYIERNPEDNWKWMPNLKRH